MICVFDIGNNYFEGNGNAVLTPTDAKVKMVAGGNYDLAMNHPMDPEGKWRHLVPGAVVRAPIPEEEIENAFAGYAADVYKTTEEAALREGPNEPTAINYPQWNWQQAYEIGNKVSVSGWSHRNYECTYYDGGSQTIMVPPYNSSWWKAINDTTGGAAVLVTLPAGTELYFIEDVDATWYKMSTYYGIEGYIKKSQVAFWKHLTPEETKPRIIREQLFRITNATADTKSHVVNVTAQHVSYDLNGIIVQDVSIRQASPAMAIGRMVEGFMIPYDGTIATNLTSDDNGTYTDDIKGKTGMYCFLDPDKGIVGKFDAALKRDNWDLFILQKTNTNRGFSIRYRKNLLGVSWARKSDGLITRVVPVAKDEKGEALYLPEKWIDSDYINDYPVIRMERLSMKEQVGKDKGTGDGSTWTLSDLYDEMRAKAAERFTVDKVDRIVDEVTVDFEQLGDTDEHAALKGFEKVLLYDAVTVIHEEIGLNMVMTVNELEWDAIRQKITSVKVSNVGNRAGRSVTGYNVQNKSIGWQKLTDDVGDDILSQVRDIIPEYADPEAPRPAIPVMNTKTQDGYVLKGGSNANKVWGTDDQGNPGWRDEQAVSGFIPESEKGAANGVATLDNGGKVPATQLPSYVDDVLEYANTAAFPATGEAGKIYVAKDTGFEYRWSGTQYVRLNKYDEATQSASGLMSASDKTKLDGIEAQANKYVLPQATSGALGGIKIGWTGTGKDYPVELDSNGKAHVVVPWTDTTYTLPLAASGTRGGIQIGYSESGKKYAVKLDSEKAYVEVPWTADGGNAATVNGKTVAANVPADAKFTDHEYTAGTGLSLSNGQFAVRLAYSTSGKNYKVQADNSGNLYVNVPWENTVYSLPLAANGTRGGVQIGFTQSGQNYPVQLSGEKMYVNVPWENTTYSAGTGISISGTNNAIAVQTGYSSSGKNYAVQAGTGGLYVNVPWTDQSGNDRVLRTGDTMTGTLSIVGDNSSAIMYLKNTSTDIGLSMRSTSDGTHGFISDGYWNGSARVLDAEWMLYRDSTGAIKLNGDADTVDGKHASAFVLKSGDTMTGNLNIELAGTARAYVKNTTTSCAVYLESAPSGVHGLASSGYWNGSAFVTGGTWLVQRGTNGEVVYSSGRTSGKLIAYNSGQGTGNYTGGIELREYNRSGASLEDTLANAPGLTFHWGSVTLGKFHMRKDGYLYWGNHKLVQNSGTWSITATGNVAKSGDTMTGDLWVGDWSAGTAQSNNHYIGVRSGAGRLYLWSQAATTGNCGMTFHASDGTFYNVVECVQDGTIYFNGRSNNSLKLAGYEETSFMRHRATTGTAEDPSLWSQIGIKQYNNALPDGLTGVYRYGAVISFPGSNSRFDIYASHTSSNGNGLYYRTGWNTDKQAWRVFLDSGNYSNYAVPLTGGTMTGNLLLQKAGDIYVEAKNSTTGASILLDAGSGSNHGLYSRGYYTGSAFTSSAKWILYRGSDGKIYLDGECVKDTYIKSVGESGDKQFAYCHHGGSAKEGSYDNMCSFPLARNKHALFSYGNHFTSIFRDGNDNIYFSTALDSGYGYVLASNGYLVIYRTNGNYFVYGVIVY